MAKWIRDRREIRHVVTSETLFAPLLVSTSLPLSYFIRDVHPSQTRLFLLKNNWAKETGTLELQTEEEKQNRLTSTLNSFWIVCCSVSVYNLAEVFSRDLSNLSSRCWCMSTSNLVAVFYPSEDCLFCFYCFVCNYSLSYLLPSPPMTTVHTASQKFALYYTLTPFYLCHEYNALHYTAIQ